MLVLYRVCRGQAALNHLQLGKQLPGQVLRQSLGEGAGGLGMGWDDLEERMQEVWERLP